METLHAVFTYRKLPSLAASAFVELLTVTLNSVAFVAEWFTCYNFAIYYHAFAACSCIIALKAQYNLNLLKTLLNFNQPTFC